MTVMSSDAPATGALQDEEIYCPICNYNLTGNLAGRCSECGSLFNRDLLIEAQRAAAENLMPWDSPEPMPLLTRWWRTVRISCVQPKGFACAFGVQPRRSRASGFLLSVLFLASCAVEGGLLLTATFAERASELRQTLSSVAIILVGTVVIGTLGATLLTACAYWYLFPHADGCRRFRPWLSIVSYAACHCLFMLLFPLIMIVPILTRDWAPEWWVIATYFGLGMMCVLLWAGTLRSVVACRLWRPGLAPRAALVTILIGVGCPALVLFALGGLLL